jgi:Fe-S cluster assembly protein SufD
VHLERPVCIRYLTSTNSSTAQPRLLLQLGAGAKATVVEHFHSSAPAIVNPIAEVHCASGADLNYFRLQEEHPDSWHTSAQYARLGEDANFRATLIEVGGRLARNDLRIELAGPRAHADARGLFMADGSRHVESRIDVRHLAPATTSHERFRGILAGKARGVFNGRIYVDSVAQQTAAELSNRNLLLSAGAEIDTKPELEIYADDVKCAHGSTTGQLDNTALFYLLSRGVEPTVARNMLITAFAAELLSDIDLPGLAERAQAALDNLREATDE